MLLKVSTNHQYRDLITWGSLTDEEKKEFDYLKDEQEQYAAQFFRYRGSVYCLDGFVTTQNTDLKDKWDGIAHETFFSGVLVRISRTGEHVKVGSYSC